MISYLEKNSLRTREDVATVLLEIIRPLKPYYSQGHAWLHVGDTGAHYGEKAARMEGFARILWGLGPLWAQEEDNRRLSEGLQKEIEEWRLLYLDGIIHGTDPAHQEYWGEVVDYDQKMVEMAALVTAVSLSPDKLWNPLSAQEKENLYQWLNQINQRKVHLNNWRYFRILVNMMFRLLGLPWSKENTKDDFEVIESCYDGDGWYYDGNAGQLDYYIPFAMHFYGLIYASFMEKEEPELVAKLKFRAERFSSDFIYWFAQDGEEIPYGRSLTYRFAHGAFFSAMSFAKIEGIGIGEMKHLALRNLEAWLKRPIFDSAGILTIGYSYPNLFMSERYNSPGSPYWAFKAFLMLALPEEHSYWMTEEKLPNYEPQKLLEKPHMLITHDDNQHVIAYTAGQHCQNHGSTAEKYEKFVYSNKFGFSVSRGNTLRDGAFDNTLAVSEAGEEYYRMRYGTEEYHLTEEYVFARYRIGSVAKIESTVVPLMSWHVRIHKIHTERAIDIADGGFSIGAERCFEAVSGAESGKYTANMIQLSNHSVAAVFPWGTSAVVSMTGGIGELINVFPNTNLFYNLTVLPTIKQRLEPGEHLVITCVYGDQSCTVWEKEKEIPKVAVEESEILISYRDRKIVVAR